MVTAVKTKGFDKPHPSYAPGLTKWKRARAILGGEEASKQHDAVIDTVAYTNLLIPFSPKMEQTQYNFYRAEAELPGISSQFLAMLMSSLLKTPPEVTLPQEAPAEAQDWILNNFGQDSCSLQLFMKDCLEEELTTSRAWVYVDRPYIEKSSDLDPKDVEKKRPFPVLWKAEEIINFQEGLSADGYKVLKRVVVKRSREVPSKDSAFETVKLDVYVSHELDAAGQYQVVTYELQENGECIEKVNNEIFYNDEKLPFIPAWPLNGKVEIQTPMLSTFINKEVALYNKISRRNHLLYGAATYTPYVASDMPPERFNEIVDAGLGCWFKIDKEDKVGILQTPTEALQDMDRAILASMDEIARLGIRLLTPEVSQSGIALEIRNAAQTSQLGFLAELLNILLSRIITFMLNWRYNLQLKEEDVIVRINSNLLRQSATAQWAELATQWYEAKLIPRSLWLSIIKSAEIFPADYDDKKGQEEINTSGTNVNSDDSDTDEINKVLAKLQGK